MAHIKASYNFVYIMNCYTYLNLGATLFANNNLIFSMKCCMYKLDNSSFQLRNTGVSNVF